MLQASNGFVQLVGHSWIDIGWGRAWSGHLCFLMDCWLLLSPKHDLGVLQKPAIANIVHLDIPNERLTALGPGSCTPSLKRESSVMMSSVRGRVSTIYSHLVKNAINNVLMSIINVSLLANNYT